MSLKEQTYYFIECDEPGCGVKTGDLGDYSAWSDGGQAVDDWINSDGYQDEATGEFFCEEHRPALCVECDARATGVDAGGEDGCDEHKVTESAATDPAGSAA